MEILHKIHRVSKFLQPADKMIFMEKSINEIEYKNNMNTLDKIIEETQSILRPLIKKYIKRSEKTALKAILQECIKAKESYDRALFVRLGCEAVGGNWQKVLHAMAAVELTDFSVLAIDDILDEAPRRMGMLAIHKRYGEKIDIIVASILKSIATEALVESARQNQLNSHKLTKVILLLEHAHRQIYVGQYLDIYYEGLEFEQVTNDMYLEMIKYTTGIQISACIQIGAILGGGKEEEVNALRDYGLYIGMLFQIRDDLIDYIDNEELIRKIPFLDFQQRKKRWPILFAYQNNPKKVQKLLSLHSIPKDEIQNYINQNTIINRIKKIVNKLANNASMGLEFIKVKKIKSLLEEIVNLATDI